MNQDPLLQALRSLLEPCFSEFGTLVSVTLWKAPEGKPGPYGSCTTIKFEGEPEQTVDYWKDENLDEEVDPEGPLWGVNTTTLLQILNLTKEQEEALSHRGEVLIHRNIEECRYVEG